MMLQIESQAVLVVGLLKTEMLVELVRVYRIPNFGRLSKEGAIEVGLGPTTLYMIVSIHWGCLLWV